MVVATKSKVRTSRLTDALRLKAGASTGLAVRCGTYPGLGTVFTSRRLTLGCMSSLSKRSLSASLPRQSARSVKGGTRITQT